METFEPKVHWVFLTSDVLDFDVGMYLASHVIAPLMSVGFDVRVYLASLCYDPSTNALFFCPSLT